MKNSKSLAKAPSVKPLSRAAAAILESAKDLESMGTISKRTLRGYEKSLREGQPAERSAGKEESAQKEVGKMMLVAEHFLTPVEIAKIRARAHASQGYFAKKLRVSQSTVQQWESGAKKPRGMAVTLLEVVDKHGLEILA